MENIEKKDKSYWMRRDSGMLRNNKIKSYNIYVIWVLKIENGEK